MATWSGAVSAQDAANDRPSDAPDAVDVPSAQLSAKTTSSGRPDELDATPVGEAGDSADQGASAEREQTSEHHPADVFSTSVDEATAAGEKDRESVRKPSAPKKGHPRGPLRAPSNRDVPAPLTGTVRDDVGAADDPLSYDAPSAAPVKQTRKTALRPNKAPWGQSLFHDEFPTYVYGTVGIVIGMLIPIMATGFGGVMVAQAFVVPNPEAGFWGVVGLLSIGAGVVSSAPLGIAGAGVATAFRQLARGESISSTLLGTGVGLGVVAGAIGASFLAVGIAGRSSGNPVLATAALSLSLLSGLMVVGSGPAALAATVLIEDAAPDDAAIDLHYRRRGQRRPTSHRPTLLPLHGVTRAVTGLE